MRLQILFAAALILFLQLAAQARPLDLRADCGAVGDGVADDAPAFVTCFDKVAQRQGSTVQIPAGKYRVATPVLKNFLNLSTSLIIRGVGSASQVMPATADAGAAFKFQNLENLTIEDVYFVGNPHGTNDAFETLSIQTVYQATLRNTHFYGLISSSGGSVVRSFNTDLLIDRCSFRGSTTFAAAVVNSRSLRGLTIRNTDFIDYGTIDGRTMSRTGIYGPLAWVQVEGAQPVNHADSQTTVEVRNVRMDEGALYGFLVYTAQANAPKIRGVDIRNLSVNLQHQGAGVYISNTESVRITDSWFGYTQLEHNIAVLLRTVTSALIKNSRGAHGAQRVFAEADCGGVVIEDSHFATLSVPAKILTVIRNGRPVPRTALFDLERLKEN